MFDYNAAEKAAMEILAKAEKEFGVQWLVSDVVEKEFGWVFLYDTRENVEAGDGSVRFSGNAPLIFDKSDGVLYISGAADSLAAYLEQYRRGVRTPA